GLSYRLFKEWTNAGQYDEALAVYRELKEQFLVNYDIDIDSPPEYWLHQDRAPFGDFTHRYPMCLCGVAYFRGIIALNHEDNPALAAQFFSAAINSGTRLRESLNELGADDAETEHFVEHGRILYLRALTHIRPAEAAAGCLELLAKGRNTAFDRENRRAALEM